MSVFARANDAIHANPDYTDQEHITTHGSDWLWAAFAVMLLSDLALIGWHFAIPRGQRVFHQLAVMILTTAAITYFSMASDLGYASIATEFSGPRHGSPSDPAGSYRQVWYVRYIDWTITTPLLLLELVLVSGLPLSDIITVIFFSLVMVITGLVGALVRSSYKWGYFALGVSSLFYIWWALMVPARVSAGAIGAAYQSSFTRSAALLSFLWLLYPIAWGLSEGGNVITPDSEMIFYGVLDVLTKPVFLITHLFFLSKLDLSALQLSSGKFSTAASVAAFDREKYAGARGDNVAPTDNATTGANANKKSLWGRKGRYDAPATTTTTGNAPVTNMPRPSESTVVSQ